MRRARGFSTALTLGASWCALLVGGAPASRTVTTLQATVHPAGPGVVSTTGPAVVLATGPASPRWDDTTRLRPVIPMGLDLYLPVPEDNPLTRAKVVLGERLFFDPQLSVDHTVSCSSCHRPDHAFSDTSAVSRGVGGQLGRRNAPSLLNAAYRSQLFWDGRVRALEEQALQPIQSPAEMGLDLAALERRLRTDDAYPLAFRAAFPDEEGPVEADQVARALASYVRTLLAGAAPIDRLVAGDTAALSPLARRGMRLFQGRANCAACHVGPTFRDGVFHNTGVSWGSVDAGRSGVTGRAADLGRFKTPSLRDVARTAPYMHDGSVRTLEEVIEFYDRGGGANPYLDREIRPLGLSTDERAALLAFLRALSSEPPVDDPTLR